MMPRWNLFVGSDNRRAFKRSDIRRSTSPFDDLFFRPHWTTKTEKNQWTIDSAWIAWKLFVQHVGSCGVISFLLFSLFFHVVLTFAASSVYIIQLKILTTICSVCIETIELLLFAWLTQFIFITKTKGFVL